MTEPLSRVTAYSYDNLGRVRTQTLPDPDGTGALTSPVTTYAYNAASWMTSLTDPRGGVTTAAYDALGRTTSITEPDPDGAGVLTSAVTSYTYGSRGLASITDALSRTTSYAYDTLGNVASVTDPAGKATVRTFDIRGRLLTETTPDPDGAGALTAAVTSYVYDGLGRLRTKQDALGGTTSYGYDGVDNLISLKDPVNNTTSWSYDALDRVTMETNALNKSRSYVYDPAGNLTRKTDRNGRVTQYDYDQINRLTAEKWMSGTSQTPTVAITTTQDGGAQNEIQNVGYSDPYGGFWGTFTLSYGGNTTAAIAVGASAATVQSALEGLASIGSGNVSVTKTTVGTTSVTWTITFQGILAQTNVGQVTINTASMGSFIFLTKIENTQANGHVLQDEIQTVALSNATGGTFRLAYLGQTTQPIAYNASAAAVDAALEALSTVGTGAVTVSLAASTYTITFGGGALNDTNVNSLQGDVSTATYGTVDRTLTTTYNAVHEITQQSDPSATIAYTRDNLVASKRVTLKRWASVKTLPAARR